MSGTGVSYQDLVPVPEKTNAVTDPDQHEKSHALDDGETASHALATGQAGEHDEQGVAQIEHDLEVKDLGWNAPKDEIPAPLVGGMDNEYLWMLVRRFNKVCRLWSSSQPWTLLMTVDRTANVPCERDHKTCSWQSRSEHCRRR